MTQGFERSSHRVYSAVLVEAGAGLSSELPGAHHAAQQRHRGEVGVGVLGVERVEDGERRVEPHEVEQREGAHRETAAALHRRVDALLGRDALLEQAHGVVQVGKEQRVHDEARLVLHLDRLFVAGEHELGDRRPWSRRWR